MPLRGLTGDSRQSRLHAAPAITRAIKGEAVPYRDPEKRVSSARERMRRLRSDPAYQQMRYQREAARRRWRLANDPEWAARYRAVSRRYYERQMDDPELAARLRAYWRAYMARRRCK